MTYNVPPRGYIDWTIAQRHGYEREVRQRALQLIDQAVANCSEGVHLAGYMADLNWYYEYGDSVNVRGSIRDSTLPTTRGGRVGDVQDGHGSAHQSDVVEQVDATLSDLSTPFPTTIKSSIHHQASSSSGGGSMFAKQQTSVHNSNGTWELSLEASSQSATSSRTLKR
ncbi:hypothetical protein BOTNAR_0296g00130 [Botryotinia narcissicola]|uniref:Uncharacterized protein n=1 Tax=Botryotinia narcissicola TaxID=278944 RepID=A0A4Z1HVY5_9HELO|nr:hypothetical protein BOTNAR_0296g00130 [Botryotinia narcissicola]